ncbi:MAG: FAD-binding oxidoreductase, partial [bacterium]|nr:FAD-binding oxidoreductase [bacterium]
ISTGKNWGLGSRLPVRSPSVLVDLSGMNRILDFDETLGTITVQPGVTFAQIDGFLAQRHSNLFLAPTGGSPDASLLANALERGDGNGIYGDRANAVAGLEVVLPNGDIVHTGFRRFGQGRLAATHRYGVGPALDGLFFQSNLGVVTEATCWLQPKPAYFQGFSCTLASDAELPGLLNAVRDLTLSGTIPSGSFAVWNRYKRLAAKTTYRDDAIGGKTPLSPEQLGAKATWMASCSLYADSQAIGRAQRELVQAMLGGLVEQIRFFDRDHPPSGFSGTFPAFTSTGANLRTAYWRKSEVPDGPLDLDRDRCGVLWLCPAAPFCGETITEIFTLSESLALAQGFEAHLGLNPTSGRSVNIFIALMFDLDLVGESEKAMACHDALMAALVARGHLPYRLGVQSMHAVPQGAGAYARLLNEIRQVVDPCGILAPGRYAFDGSQRPG